jgi:predicted nucleic acid-binding protein
MRAIDTNVLVRLITRDDEGQARQSDRFVEKGAWVSPTAQFRARPALGFSDCLMLQLARKAGQLLLGTFDRALEFRASCSGTRPARSMGIAPRNPV